MSDELSPKYVDAMQTAVQTCFRQARQLLLENVGKVSFTSKTDGTPVTDIDHQVEAKIFTFMMEHFPEVAVFGEETGYTDDLPETFWLIDPIDGTKSYVQNIPAFTSMAVLIHADKAVASVIYNPTSDDMYVALAGRGATRNGQKLDLSQIPLPKQVLCKSRLHKSLTDLLTSQEITVTVGPSGAGQGFLQIANGEAAARFHLHSGPHPHDHAPGALLVSEAGGRIIPILEDTYSYRTRSFVACHPDLADFIDNNRDKIKSLEDPNQTLL